VGEKVVYITSSYYLLLASASLGQGQPEVKPSTPEPLPERLRELPGKLGWMKWEPPLRMPLSEGRRSRERCVKWSEEAEANKGGRKRR